MALYPKAIQKPIKPGPTDPRLDVVVGTVGHVAVSEADSLHGWFNGPSGGVESHFYIRYTGVVEQYRDTAYEADAQGGGNSWLVGSQRYGYVSYETEGMGSGKWTAAQLTAIKELITWVNVTHGSPWQKTPAYHGRGHGYHSLFSQWNPSKHSCPGPDRIVQFNTIIVPWLNAGGKADDLTPEEVTQAVIAAFKTDGLVSSPAVSNPTVAVVTGIGNAGEWALQARDRVTALSAQVASLTAVVSTLAANQGLDPVKVEQIISEAVDAALSDLRITRPTE